jgi:GrpB-like predicted nucleotidyltransferase (UPF0157 family)
VVWKKKSKPYIFKLMDFERQTDNPLKSMGIGVDARLKDTGVKFLRTQHGEPIFVKGEDPQTTVSVRPVNWNAEQLRAMADYLDAHPETTKCIEVIEDDSPSQIAGWGNPATPQVQPWLGAMGMDDPISDLDDIVNSLKTCR